MDADSHRIDRFAGMNLFVFQARIIGIFQPKLIGLFGLVLNIGGEPSELPPKLTGGSRSHLFLVEQVLQG